MSWLTQAFHDTKVRVLSLFGRHRMRARMAEEMATHVAMREEQLIAAGSSPAEARRRARREFGNIAVLKESAADMWKYGTLERLAQDVRYGVRTLGRTPGFTAIAVTILALGIGVNATVFSVIDAYFLNQLPVADPGRVVRVYSNRVSNTRLRTYQELRDRNSTLEGLAAFQMISAGLRIDRETEHAFGQIVSGNYFPLLGVHAAHGRLLTPGDDAPAAPPVALLSYAFWQQRFAASPDVLGRTIAINDQPFTVVGVVERDYTGAMSPLVGDFWVPLSADAVLRPALDANARLDSLSIHQLGRLKRGITRQAALVDLDGIGRQVRAATGSTETQPAVSIYPATMLHPEIATPIAAFVSVLMAVVGIVLLIVCVNVANLVLARSASRQIELAIRQSIGAGRGRLIRQLLTENMLLAVTGAAGGLAVAYWLTHLLMTAQLPAPVPMALRLSIDWRVLAFLALVVVGTTLAFGMAPALSASRLDLVRVLKDLGGPDRRHGRMRAGFLVAQVSLSVLLLVMAGLFLLAQRSAQTIDLGFKADHVLTASIDLEARGYTADRGRDFLGRLVERLNASPGVVASNALDILPVTISNNAGYFLRDGDTVAADTRLPPMPIVYSNGVGPGHFTTLQIDLIAGRDFTAADTDGAPLVAIVNERLARTFWPDGTAIGRRLTHDGGSDRRPVEVIGIARDSQYVTIGEEPRLFLYQPLAQAYSPRPSILVRATGSPATALPILTSVVRDMDPGLPVFNVATMEDATSISILPAKIAGRLLAVLGTLAVLLSGLGTYGVLSYLFRSRRRELAIRMAIGAAPRAIAVMVVRQALVWTGVGAVIGMIAALLVTRFLASFLYGVSPRDPLTLASVVVLIALVACAAAFVPAWRASRLDPLATLRES